MKCLFFIKFILNGNKKIKNLLIILCFIFVSNLKCNDSRKELNITGSSKTTIKSFYLYKEGKFSSFSSEGTWTNNFGNYGRSKCMGVVRFLSNNNMELNNMCESIDKSQYKTWSLYKRSGPLDSGVGTYEIVDTTLPNRKLFIGMKCNYAIKYMDEINFSKSKCKITEKMEKILKEVANELKDQ